MNKLKWATEKRKVKDLVLYENNPRTITDEKMNRLVKSIDKLSLAEIPAIDADNVIIAGNQRVKALIALKKDDEEIDVRVPNRKLTENEFKEYLLTSNIPAGDWDFDKLAKDFDAEFLDYVGFDMDFIDDLFTPDFKPTSAEEQGKLDQTPEYECPKCGYKWSN